MISLKDFARKCLMPHLVPLALLIAIGVIYFLPGFQGYSLKQGDMKNAKGMAGEAIYYHESTGDYAWWNASMFSGMPNTQIWGDYEGNWSKYIVRLYQVVPMPFGIWIMAAICMYIMLIHFSINRWLSLLGALAYGFSSYLLIIIEVGHVTKALAYAFMPLVFGGVVLLFQGKSWRGLLFLSLGMTLELGSNHVQVTYYLGMLCLIYVIFKAVELAKEKNLKGLVRPALLAAAAVVIAVMSNFPVLYNTLEYGKFTTRGASNVTINPDGSSKEADQTDGLDRSYVTAWSYGWQESLSFFIPNAVGGATGAIGNSKYLEKADPRFRQNIAQSNHYWGNQSFTSGPVYVGAGIFLLALLALVFVRGPLKWALFAGAIMSFFLALGKNFMPLTNFFLDYLPGYDKFRAVTIILVILELCIPALAILFLHKLITQPKEILAEKKKFFITSGIFLGILLILIAIPDSFLRFTSAQEQEAFTNQANQNAEMAQGIQQFVDNLKEVRQGIFRADALRSFGIALGFALLVFLFVTEKIKATYLYASLITLLLVDLWPIDKRYLHGEKQNGRYVQWEKNSEYDFPFSPSQNDLEIYNREIQANPNLQSKIDAALVNMESALERGKALPLLQEREQWFWRFNELKNHTHYRVLNLAVSTFNDAGTSYFHKSIGGYHGAKLKRYQELVEFHFSGGLNRAVLNMLNTKYIITQNGVQQNPDACGAAWFVDSLVTVSDANEEIKALGAAYFDPNSVAIAEESQQIEAGKVSPNQGQISLVDIAPNRLEYTAKNDQAGLAVFSEIYYPVLWSKALVDGKEVEVKRVNYLLRAIELPAGDHKIEFIEDRSIVDGSEMVAYAGSLILLLILIFSGFKAIKTEA